MVASRLTEIKKRALVDGYRSGGSTASLAVEFGCSPNTVIRTVKTLLSADEYIALKAARTRGDMSRSAQINSTSAAGNQKGGQDAKKVFDQSEVDDCEKKESNSSSVEEKVFVDIDLPEETSRSGPLALDDADDFGEDQVDDQDEEVVVDRDSFEFSSADIFQEIAPLASDFVINEQKEVASELLEQGVLPSSVYMLVDKTVELDVRFLKDFPELGVLSENDRDRQALCLFNNQRSAKRQCGRSQRVIKVPDTSVFETTTPFLLARGITHLVLESKLIALKT